MRILFAQLCKLYTFFLVTIATVALGAPLGAPLDNAPILKRDTNPGCPPDYPVYFSSHCENAGLIAATCKTNGNPPVYRPNNYTPCQPHEHCIEHYSPIGFDPKNPSNPHATCVTDRNADIWDNFNNPSADACSVSNSYNNRGQPGMLVAMTIYAHDLKPIQVNRLVAYDNNNELPAQIDLHNYTSFISNYNNDKIKFCFNTGTNAKVTAYAAVWAVYPNSMPGDDLPSDDSSNTIDN
uniref:Putative pectinesterase 8 n=1 Tax=Anthurium amnicola TaxID=1678845 RepID=A0A1D1ZA34_9ARAE